MTDTGKSKSELLRELEELRQQLRSNQEQHHERIDISVDQFRMIFKEADDLYVLVDLKAKMIECNAAVEKITGFTRAELLEKNLLKANFVRGKEKVKAAAALSRSALGKPTDPQEFNFHRKDGRQILIKVRTIPARYKGDTYVLAIIRDVTAEKTAGQSSEWDARKYQTILKNFPDVIVLIDPQGKILEVNERVREWIGYDPADVIGTNIADLKILTPKSKALVMMKFTQRFMGTGSPEPYEAQFITKDGRELTGLLQAEIIKDAQGNPQSELVIISDVTEQRKIRREKEEESRFLKTLLSNFPGMVYRCGLDEEWTMLYVSQGGLALTGYRPEDLIGNQIVSYASLIHPEDHDRVWQIIAEATKQQQPFELEYRIHTADGQEKWIWEIGRGVFDKSNSLLYLEGILNDITERRKADMRLRESQQRFKSMFVGHPEPAVYLDSKMHVLDVNPRFEALFGFRKEEMIGKHINSLIVPDAKSSEGEYLDAKSSQGYVSFDTVRHTRSGKEVPVSISAGPVEIEGQMVNYFAIYKDISEREKTRLEAQRARQLFESMFMGNPEPAVYLDEKFTIIKMNPRFQEVFGFTFEEVAGKHIDQVIVQEDCTEEARMLDQMAEEGYVYFDTRRRRKDGEMVPVSISAAPVKVNDEKAGYFVLYKDISDREKVVQALRESEEKHRLLVENINDGVVISQADKFVFINGQFARMLGYTVDELQMRDFRDVYTEEGQRILYERQQRRESGEEVSPRYETKFRRKDGSELQVEASVTIFEYRDELATFGVIRDITERKAAEAAIRKREIQYKSLFNQIADPIFIFDDKTHYFLDCNIAVERTYGYSKEEICHMTPFDLHPKEEQDRVKENIDIANVNEPHTYRHLTKSGKTLDVEILSDQIDYRGQAAWLAIVRDVTERKQIEAEREQMITKLQDALNRVKKLSGLVPICAGCKRIRDDSGYWNEVEHYIAEHSDAQFSHGLCPECMKKYYPEFVEKQKQKKLQSE